MKKLKFTKGHGVMCHTVKEANALLKLAHLNNYLVVDPYDFDNNKDRNFFWDGDKFIRCSPKLIQYKLYPSEFLKYISQYEEGDYVQINTDNHKLPRGTDLVVLYAPDNQLHRIPTDFQYYVCRKFNDALSSDLPEYRIHVRDLCLLKNNNKFLNDEIYESILTPLTDIDKKCSDRCLNTLLIHNKKEDQALKEDHVIKEEKKPIIEETANLSKEQKDAHIVANRILNNSTYGNVCKPKFKLRSQTKLKPKPIMETTKDKYIIPADLLRAMYTVGSEELQKALSDNVHPFTGEVLAEGLKFIIKLSKGYSFESALRYDFKELFVLRISDVLIGKDSFQTDDAEFLLTVVKAGEYKDIAFGLNNSIFNWELKTYEQGRLLLMPTYKT